MILLSGYKMQLMLAPAANLPVKALKASVDQTVDMPYFNVMLHLPISEAGVGGKKATPVI